MRTLQTTILSQRSRPLKVVSALDTLPSREQFLPLVLVKRSMAKPSPYKALYRVGEQVQDPAAWDSQWFGHYE